MVRIYKEMRGFECWDKKAKKNYAPFRKRNFFMVLTENLF